MCKKCALNMERKKRRGVLTLALLICLAFCATALGSDWKSAPRPTFPADVLKAGVEGSVKLRVMFAEDGSVVKTVVVRSSGSHELDAAAQTAVAKWKLKPSAITSADLQKGREEIVEFKQEALVAAVYPDRKGYFANFNSADLWMFAPFPSYPYLARSQHKTGVVMIKAAIGPDGKVSRVDILQSSGHIELDEAAVKAVRLWRAHKQYAGKSFKFPITFTVGGRR